ncbi:MAG: efflux RND transporter periplasmic adaptor subunit [Verrucomicrobiota bacterium]
MKKNSPDQNKVRRKILSPLQILLISLGIVAIAVCVIIVMVALSPEPPVKEVTQYRPTVEVVRVESKDHVLEVKTQGTVSPRTQTDLAAEVPGRLIERSDSMEPGSSFKKGDVLFRIDPRDYEAALATAKADVARAEANLATELAQAQQAKSDWEIIGEGEPSDLVLRKPQLAQAQANLDGAIAAAGKAQIDLDRTYIRAPYDGRTLTKIGDVGQFINNFAPDLGTVFATDYAEVRLPLSSEQLQHLDLMKLTDAGKSIQPKTKVILTADLAGQERTWEAEVSRMEATVDSRTRLFYLIARVQRPYDLEFHEAPLVMGLFVNARIIGRVAASTFELPRRALYPNDLVHVITPEETLELRQVAVLADMGDRIIIESGLEDGERISVTPITTPVNGMKVQVESAPGLLPETESLEIANTVEAAQP